MTKCPFCYFENEDGALFCEQCKSDLTGVPSTPSAAAPGHNASPVPVMAEPVPLTAEPVVAEAVPMLPEAVPAGAGPLQAPPRGAEPTPPPGAAAAGGAPRPP